MNKTFLFQVNVTRDCNLRCTHCYISTDKKVSSKYMSKHQLIETFSQIVRFLNSDHSKALGYTFAEIHIIGGEPTLLGLDFFKETIPEIKSLLGNLKIKYRLGVVSNLLTPESVDIALLFDAVSTSYEVGTRFISWKGNPKASLERLWVENVRKLQNDGVNVALTMAITRNAIDLGAKTILDGFFKEGFRHIHVGFFIPSGDGRKNAGQIAPTFLSTSRFLIDATEWYLEICKTNDDVYLNPVESLIEAIYFDRPSDDIICPIIPGSLDIDWDGETVTCIEAGGETNMKSLGNVFKDGIDTILSSREYLRERTKAIVPNKNCAGCDEIEVCQSACGILQKQWNGGGDECPGFKQFIKHVRNIVESGRAIPKSIKRPSNFEFRTC